MILFISLSCQEGPYTIFENIVNDDPIKDYELDNKLNVMQIAATTDNYYIACGKLMRNAKTSSPPHWTSIGVGGGFVVAVAVAEPYIFAGIVNDDGTGKLVYVDEDNLALGVTDITPGSVDQIVKLKTLGGGVVASVRYTDGTFRLYDISVGSQTQIGSIAVTDPIIDFTENGTYCITATDIMNNSGTPYNPVDTYTFTSIFYNSDDANYYAGTANGYLLRTDDPSTTAWEPSPKQTFSKNGITSDVRFISITNLDSNKIITGTRGAGFYTVDTATFDTTGIVRFDLSAKRELFEGVIECIHEDGGTVFFGTMGAGLWSNTWDEPSATWTAEWTRG